MTEANELVFIEQLTPLQVFSNDGLDPVIAKIEAEARSYALDISTEEGRKQIASLAYKVARSKTALDSMGKALTEDWKAKAGAVDVERKRMRERLDALRDEVRAPLTEWENREKARVAGHEDALAALPAPAGYGLKESAAEIQDRIGALENLPPRDWQEFTVRARKLLADEIERMRTLLAAARKRESEAAEVARLRQEEADRQQSERDERLQKEAAAQARAEAQAALAQAALEKEKAERRADQAEADLIATEERTERDRIAAAKQAERDAEAAAQRERDRIDAEQKAEAVAREKREANKRHKAKIHREALAGLVAAGCSEEIGNAVIDAIAAGAITHLAIQY